MKNKQLISICERCGHLNLKKKSKILGIVKSVLFTMLVATSVIGSCGIINFAMGDTPDVSSDLYIVGGFYAFIENIVGNFRSNDKLNEIALNITKECKDNECKLKKIYSRLILFKYERGSEKNPMIIWNEQEGDCDEISLLAKILLREVGIYSSLQCSHRHCWLIVFPGDKTFLLDIVSHKMEIIK